MVNNGKCIYGNDANKLGALYNFLQKQKLEICIDYNKWNKSLNQS